MPGDALYDEHVSWFETFRPELDDVERDSGRYFEGPAVGPDGLRARVGATHLPLGAFLYAFLDAGLELDAFEELGLGEPGRLFPYRVALRLRRVSPVDVARARTAG